MRIKKTVIGSFPRSSRPLAVALKEVVDLQLHYGVDLITDGEQRSNMIQYFNQIPGTEVAGSSLRIAGKIKPLKAELLDEFYKIKDYRTIQSILKSRGKENTKTKITITGPITLGTIVASTDINSTAEHYNLDDEETLFSDFSDALLPIVEKALSLGAYVQIDEPQLSTGQVTLKTAKKILKNFTSRLPANAIKEEKVSCHVCGSIKSVAGLYDVLLGLDIPILSFGFSGDTERENFDVVSKASLQSHGKKLGAGFISNVTVEEDRAVLERLNRIVGLVGVENIRYLHPDCGFGLTRLEKVKLILKKMQKIGDAVN
ncbi:MAG: hypothetical protein ABSG33_02050 [Candidatus Bathyarchaeia archaeon]|jgi:methionine synthase II (cobalamin-independent)